MSPTKHDPIYDPAIMQRLKRLSLADLRELSHVSGATANSGYLWAEWRSATRADFIEEIGELHDKLDWQIERIRDFLDLTN